MELLLPDMERIAKHLSMSVVGFFERYCSVHSLPTEEHTGVPGPEFTVGIGMMPPCPFIAHGRCSIHYVRPVNCRLFPEKIIHSDESEYWKGLYPCMDRGFVLSGSQERELLVDLEEYRELQEYSCMKIPVLKTGIRFDETVACRIPGRYEGRLELDSPGRRGGTMREDKMSEIEMSEIEMSEIEMSEIGMSEIGMGEIGMGEMEYARYIIRRYLENLNP